MDPVQSGRFVLIVLAGNGQKVKYTRESIGNFKLNELNLFQD